MKLEKINNSTFTVAASPQSLYRGEEGTAHAVFTLQSHPPRNSGRGDMTPDTQYDGDYILSSSPA